MADSWSTVGVDVDQNCRIVVEMPRVALHFSIGELGEVRNSKRQPRDDKRTTFVSGQAPAATLAASPPASTLSRPAIAANGW